MRSRYLHIFQHTWREERGFLWSIFLALLLTSVLFHHTGIEWWSRVDAVISLATLCVGILIWFSEAAEDWEESLPKRLTVEFWFAGKDAPARMVMTCLKAPLTGESDIRTWAIALGAQMDGGKRHLKYRPFFSTSDPEVVPDDDDQPCRHYSIRLHLEELPERIQTLEQEQGHPVRIIWRRDRDGSCQETILPQSPHHAA
jgi:hypothetical protein